VSESNGALDAPGVADPGAVAPLEDLHPASLAATQTAPHIITFTEPGILFKWQLHKALPI